MNTHQFPELVSVYLRNLMDSVKEDYGENSPEYKALYYQYIISDEENVASREHNAKHYEAGYSSKSAIRFMERLYKRQATVDITLACVAHCRYCLRQNYEIGIMSENDMSELSVIIGKDPYLRELLITGGDPLLTYESLFKMIDCVIENAPNIRIIRIGSRLPVQDPDRMVDEIYDYFEKNSNKVTFEVAMQINHAVELQPVSREKISRLRSVGVVLYAQNVLLRGVNDSLNSLVELYDELRYLNVESHYLFHPVPIEGTHRFRMPLRDFLNFARILSSSGEIPGRSKPMFSLMTDIGKVTLYDGCLGNKDSDGYYDVYTGYKLEERRNWHVGYELPDSAYVGSDGFLHVRYLDG